MADKGELFRQAEIAQYNEMERRQYETSLKEYWDYTSTLDTAYIKGEKKGREEGRRDKAVESARRMKADGMPAELIAKYTGLDMETVNSL